MTSEVDLVKSMIAGLNDVKIVDAPKCDVIPPVKTPELNSQPAQRMVVFLKAQCHSDDSIAEKTGYTVAQVQEILAQPWAQKRLIDEIQKNGEDSVTVLVAGSAVDAVITIRNLMVDEKAPPAIRLSCAKELLDRFQGKTPIGDNRGRNQKDRNVPDNLNDLDKEIARLEEQISGTIGRRTHREVSPVSKN